MKKSEKRIIGLLAILVILIFIGLGVLLYQQNNKAIQDMNYSVTVDAMQTRIYSR